MALKPLDGTWQKAIERTSERTAPAVVGPGPKDKGRVTGETVAPGRERLRATQKRRCFTSSRAQYRSPKPSHGAGDWAEGESREDYSQDLIDAGQAVIRGLRPTTPLQARPLDLLGQLRAELDKDERHHDVPAATFARIDREIREAANKLASVTTGGDAQVQRASLIAQAARRAIRA